MKRRDGLVSHGLVRFPVDDENWQNTEEGGMSVFAVWKSISNAVCAIDVGFFGIGTLVSEWACNEENENRRRILKSALSRRKPSYFPKIERSLADPADSELGCVYTPVPDEVPDWIVQGYDMMNHSIYGQQDYISVVGAVYLGSSGGSWWNEKEGRYWEADRKSLTREGLALLETLEALYGEKSLLLTVLDT